MCDQPASLSVENYMTLFESRKLGAFHNDFIAWPYNWQHAEAGYCESHFAMIASDTVNQLTTY
jgi:hypothetical protein